MKEVWRLEKATVRDVYEALREKRTIAYNRALINFETVQVVPFGGGGQ